MYFLNELSSWQLQTLLWLSMFALILLWYLLDQWLKDWAGLKTNQRLMILAGLALLSLIGIALTQPWVVANQLESLLAQQRHGLGMDLWLHLSLLAEPSLLVMIMTLAGLWLIVNGQRQAALWLLATGLLTISTIYLLQQGFAVTRPLSELRSSANFGFPSTFVTSFTVIVGLATALARQPFYRWRHQLSLVASVLILLVLLARIHLGMSWLTDGLAGLALGVLITCLSLLSWRHIFSKPDCSALFDRSFGWLIAAVIYGYQLAFALSYKLDYLLWLY